MLKSLFSGHSLANPAGWKKLQILLNLLMGFAPFLAALFPSLEFLIDKDVLGKLMAGVIGVNVYLTTATTDKIGLK